MSLKTKLTAMFAASALALGTFGLSASPAAALGQKDRQALTVILGVGAAALLLDSANNNRRVIRHAPPPPRVVYRKVYRTPPRVEHRVERRVERRIERRADHRFDRRVDAHGRYIYRGHDSRR